MLPAIRHVLSARGDGGGICGGVGRRQLDQAFCCSGAVASVGYFCSALVAGPNCASRGRCERFSWLLEVVFWVNERSVVPGAIRCDERDDRDCSWSVD